MTAYLDGDRIHVLLVDALNLDILVGDCDSRLLGHALAVPDELPTDLKIAAAVEIRNAAAEVLPATPFLGQVLGGRVFDCLTAALADGVLEDLALPVLQAGDGAGSPKAGWGEDFHVQVESVELASSEDHEGRVWARRAFDPGSLGGSC